MFKQEIIMKIQDIINQEMDMTQDQTDLWIHRDQVRRVKWTAKEIILITQISESEIQIKRVYLLLVGIAIIWQEV